MYHTVVALARKEEKGKKGTDTLLGPEASKGFQNCPPLMGSGFFVRG